MRGVMEYTGWEEITDLTRAVRPIVVMFARILISLDQCNVKHVPYLASLVHS